MTATITDVCYPDDSDDFSPMAAVIVIMLSVVAWAVAFGLVMSWLD